MIRALFPVRQAARGRRRPALVTHKVRPRWELHAAARPMPPDFSPLEPQGTRRRGAYRSGSRRLAWTSVQYGSVKEEMWPIGPQPQSDCSRAARIRCPGIYSGFLTAGLVWNSFRPSPKSRLLPAYLNRIGLQSAGPHPCRSPCGLNIESHPPFIPPHLSGRQHGSMAAKRPPWE